MVIVSGDGASGVVGAELVAPVVVRVVDAEGAPIAGQLVNFRVTSGGGSVFAGSALTNSEGLAQERWTLGISAAESQLLEARAVDNATGAALVFGVFRATPQPAAPDTVQITAGNAQSATVLTALADSFAVRVSDRYGNPVPGAVVRFSMSASDAGTLTRTTDVTSAAGIASTRLTAGSRSGNYTTTATTGARVATFSTQIRSSTPAAMTLIAGDAQTARAGSAVAVNPAVRVVDSYGNPVSGITVYFGTILPALGFGFSAVSDDAGIAQGAWKLANAAGTNTLKIEIAQFPVVPVNLTATGVAGPATKLVFVAPAFGSYGDVASAYVAPGSAVPTAPLIRVADQLGNPVAGRQVHFASTLGDGIVGNPGVTSDPNGLASTTWTLNTKGLNRLTATVDGLPSLKFEAYCGESIGGAYNGFFVEYPIIFTGVQYTRATDSVRTQVTVSYPASGLSVVANVRGREIALHPINSQGYPLGVMWAGTMPLDGLPYDTLEVVFTMSNSTSRADRFRKFIHVASASVGARAPVKLPVTKQSLLRVGLPAAATPDRPTAVRAFTTDTPLRRAGHGEQQPRN